MEIENRNNPMVGLTIQAADNGWIVTTSEGVPHVVEENEDGDVMSTTQSLLHIIVYLLCLQGNRYDKERIYITTKKGDKYEG